MDLFIASQVHAIIEDIRLLEAFVTSPLGLYSDIRMLRQSIPLSEAEDFSREEAQKRRLAYRNLTDDPMHMALDAVQHIRTSLAILEQVNDRSGSPLGAEWVARARRVLARAEQRIAGDIRAESVARVQGLCVTIDPEATGGRPVSQIAEAALQGGATMIQLRDRTHDTGDVLTVARELRAMCDVRGALFILSGDPALALSSDAHGLHLEEKDMPVHEARRVLSHAQILGRSNSTMDDVASSQAAGVDYLAVGAIFQPTSTVQSNNSVVGVQMVSRIKGIVSQPVVAVGGISHRNIAEVVGAGADCVSVGGAVTLADEPGVAARALVEAIQNAKLLTV